jgi:hypothetical protein
MFEQTGTSPAEKRKIAFPDAGTHAIASSVTARDLNSVRNETFKFAEEIMKLVPSSKD